MMRDVIRAEDSLSTTPGAMHFATATDPGYLPFVAVLVIDLHAWRASDAGWAAMRHCAADGPDLLADGRWPQHDQYGLNIVFHGRWRALAPTWNYFTYLPHRPARVLHFLGSSGRPGSPYCHPRYTLAFLTALDRTPWRGWRPDSLRPGWWWRAVRKRMRGWAR